MGPKSIDSGSSTGPSKSLVIEEGNQSTEGKERLRDTISAEQEGPGCVLCCLYTLPCTVASVRWSGLG